MRFLALDVGDRRVGVALSDETALLASPLTTIERVGPKKDLRAVAELVAKHEVGEVVVGLPKKLDGTLGPQAEKTLDFAEALRRSLQNRKVPVVTWDERFTTVIAERALLEADMSRRDRREVVDKVSAAVLLQGFLDARRAAAPPAAGPDDPSA